jgi:hypothetical protein
LQIEEIRQHKPTYKYRKIQQRRRMSGKRHGAKSKTVKDAEKRAGKEEAETQLHMGHTRISLPLAAALAYLQ